MNAKPILFVSLGSYMTEAIMQLWQEIQRQHGTIPTWVRWVVIDSVPYEGMLSHLGQQGWSPAQARLAIPEEGYVYLKSPFGERFDITGPQHEEFRDILHEERLQHHARKGDGHGAALLSAIGRFLAAGNKSPLTRAFQRNVKDLVRVRPTLDERAHGMYAEILTTVFGGTGTGGTMIVGQCLRDILPPGSVLNLRLVNPSLLDGGEDREQTIANATAMLREFQHAHSQGGSYHSTGEAPSARVFDNIIPLFTSNGHTLLRRQDVVAQVTQALMARLDPALHHALDASWVNQTAISDFDDNGIITNTQVQNVVTIRPACPYVADLHAMKLLEYTVRAQLDALESHGQGKTLAPAVAQHITSEVARLCRQYGLDRASVQNKLGLQDSLAMVRASVDRVLTNIPRLTAQQIVPVVSQLVQTIRPSYEREGAEERARACPLLREITASLHREVSELSRARPAVGFAVYHGLSEHLATIVAEVRRDIASRTPEQQRLGATIKDLYAALNGIGQRQWWLGAGRRDETARTGATQLCQTIQRFLGGQRSLDNLHTVAAMLEDGLTEASGTTLPALRAALAVGGPTDQAAIRTRLIAQRAEVEHATLAIMQPLAWGRTLFTPTLLDRGVTAEHVEADAAAHHAALAGEILPPIADYLAGATTLAEVVPQLRLYVPHSSQRTRSLEDVVREDTTRREEMLRSLRHAKDRDWSFTPLDDTVLFEQQIDVEGGQRRTVLRLALPGGPSGYLGQLCIGDGIATAEEIVAADQDEARLIQIIGGLPLYALAPLYQYERMYRAYCKRPGSISPHTYRKGQECPPLEPPRMNMQFRCERLVALAEVLLPHRVTRRVGDSFLLHTATRVSESEEALILPNREALLRWIADHPNERRAWRHELEQCAQSDPATGSRFDPAKSPRFGAYLLFCLRQECHRQGRRIRQHQACEQLQREYEDEEGRTIEVVVVDPALRPEDRLVQGEFARGLAECVNSLANENHSRAFDLCIFQGRSYEQAAEEMACPPGSIRGWLKRARQQVATCLSKKELL